MADLSVEVFHKNSEETGPGTSAGTVVSGTSTLGVHTATIGSLKELVRYRISLEGTSGSSIGGVLCRILQPTWFDAARL